MASEISDQLRNIDDIAAAAAGIVSDRMSGDCKASRRLNFVPAADALAGRQLGLQSYDSTHARPDYDIGVHD